MSFTFYSVESLPEPGAILWCKWPHRESRSHPAEYVRPVLVRACKINALPDGKTFGSLTVSYGTGTIGDPAEGAELDLIIGENEFRQLGLHKPTRFSLNPADKKHLPWCEEYFVGQAYLKANRVVIGNLTEVQSERIRQCLKRRGIEPK